MAKKRFTKGLESLFGDANEQGQQVSLFPEKTSAGRPKRDEEKKSSKGFTSQLDAFLSEAFETEAEKVDSENKEKKAPRRLAGLDLLIRQTSEGPRQSRTKLADKRRLTLAFDKSQLSSLKRIAEEEGVYLKDLIAQLIERYLSERDK
ncbi:MAG: hypothetical protein AAFZ63_06340 [Bacteroidota bacterium]